MIRQYKLGNTYWLKKPDASSGFVSNNNRRIRAEKRVPNDKIINNSIIVTIDNITYIMVLRIPELAIVKNKLNKYAHPIETGIAINQYLTSEKSRINDGRNSKVNEITKKTIFLAIGLIIKLLPNIKIFFIILHL